MSPILEDVKAVCKDLESEPLFHMSLESKELFHSNFLAWFADSFPNQAAMAFRDWAIPKEGAKWRRTEREKNHLDLIFHLPNLNPIVVENKVFSVPDEAQLAHYDEVLGAIAGKEWKGSAYSRRLLSLTPPGWDNDEHGWNRVSYGQLADALENRVAQVRQCHAFAGDLLEHYVVLIRALVRLCDLLGTPKMAEPLLLDSGIVGVLEQARVSDVVQKARASFAERELRRCVTKRGWTDVKIGSGFTRGTSLLDGYAQKRDREKWVGDAIGWQLQGKHFRLVVITSQFQGPEHLTERESYVAKRYSEWFDFAPLRDISAIADPAPVPPPGGHSFHNYNPAFVYRYCEAPGLTPEQIIQISDHYLARAGELIGRT